jgi:hypothetical protein
MMKKTSVDLYLEEQLNTAVALTAGNRGNRE